MMRGESGTGRARHADARVAMNALARGKIGHLVIEELEVHRLRGHELIVDKLVQSRMGANR